jgi:hypothetical protein
VALTLAARRALPLSLALLAAALALYAYRELPGRPFAADDYQWLLNVRDRSFGRVLERALDPGSQTHFYRPLVWLLFWGQAQLFGLNPWGYHVVSLALHLLNATLLAALMWRLTRDEGRGMRDEETRSSLIIHPSSLVFAFAALHPAPFEAVVWISAQSELLAAGLLLGALHLWRSALTARFFGATPLFVLAATALLGAALLTKESAAIGLGLLVLMPGTTWRRRLTALALPVAVTGAYLALQAQILARNEIVRSDGYGLGPQLLLNPLRTLGLVAAPLPGTQYGDAWWLPWVGGAVVLVLGLALLAGWMRDAGSRKNLPYPSSLIPHPSSLALLLVLLPTAPFASPPDSRYTYLPVMAFALLLGLVVAGGLYRWWPAAEEPRRSHAWLAALLGRWGIVGCALALAWAASGELAAREGRFAAASGPGGSLWRLAQAECGAARPARIIVVEPPLAPPHAEAIIRLACGDQTRPVIVGRDGVEDALRERSLVVAFPGGGAQVERRT